MNSLKSSLEKGINNFTDYAKNFAERVTGQEMSTTAALGATIVGCLVLFVLLSPGMLLNLPPITKGACKKKVPFPSLATGSCTSTGIYEEGEDDEVTEEDMFEICKARHNCERVFASGYTNLVSVFLHAVVFTGIIYYLLPRSRPALI